MKKTHPSILKRRRQERLALERAMLRTLRTASISQDPGTLQFQDQAILWGLERARRNVR